MQIFQYIYNYIKINCYQGKPISVYLKDPLYQNSFFIVLSSFFNSFCGFLFWILAARLYTIEDVGLATALISSMGLISLISLLGFNVSIVRFFPIFDKIKVVSTSITVIAVSSFIIGLVYLLLINITSSSILTKNVFSALAFLLFCVMNSVEDIAGTAFIAARESRYFFYENLLIALRIPLLIPFIFLDSFGIFCSIGLSFLIASIFALLTLRKKLIKIYPMIDNEFILKSLRFSSRNYISFILSSAPTLIIPIIVLNILGEVEAAKYFMAFTIGSMIMIIPGALSTSLLVEGSHGEDLRSCVIRAIRACICLLIPAIAFLFIFGEDILRLLGKDYVGSIDLLRIFVLSSPLVSIHSLFIPIQNVRMNVDSIVMLNSMRFVLLIGLSYLLMLKFGLIGLGYGWILTYAIISLWILIVAKRGRLI